jgi:hypothetical protein
MNILISILLIVTHKKLFEGKVPTTFDSENTKHSMKINCGIQLMKPYRSSRSIILSSYVCT